MAIYSASCKRTGLRGAFDDAGILPRNMTFIYQKTIVSYRAKNSSNPITRPYCMESRHIELCFAQGVEARFRHPSHRRRHWKFLPGYWTATLESNRTNKYSLSSCRRGTLLRTSCHNMTSRSWLVSEGEICLMDSRFAPITMRPNAPE